MLLIQSMKIARRKKDGPCFRKPVEATHGEVGLLHESAASSQTGTHARVIEALSAVPAGAASAPEDPTDYTKGAHAGRIPLIAIRLARH